MSNDDVSYVIWIWTFFPTPFKKYRRTDFDSDSDSDIIIIIVEIFY